MGSALLERLVAAVPPEEESAVLEYTDGNERAARFYEAHGFGEVRRESSERPDWPAAVRVERRTQPNDPG